jgi:hypothetical protein
MDTVPAAETTPVVRPLAEEDSDAYSEFLAGQRDATLYHTLAWRDVITEVFGHEPMYLVGTVGQRIAGVLPMFLIRNVALGKKLVSLPYDVGSGGPVAPDPGVQRALSESAERLALELDVNHLELRPGSRPVELGDAFQRSEPLILTTTSLSDGEEVWSRITADQRAAVRKSQRRGVSVRAALNREDIDGFYRVLSVAFRAFGTPPYGRAYFRTVWDRLAADGRVRVILAEVDGQCVGGSWMYCFGPSLISKFAVALHEAVDLRVFAALYAGTLEAGLEMGADYVSWGTSSRAQAGLIAFKERWAGESRPAAIFARSIRRAVPSIERYYDSDGLARTVWRRLPLRATELGGQILSRWFC